MSQTVFQQDIYVNGALSAKTFTPPAASISDASIAAAAGIQASKLQHRFEVSYAHPGGAVSLTERKVVHVVYGATGLILAFRAGSRTACVGAATITVDLLKNGTTVLSAVITLNSGSTAYVVQAATVTGTALVAGDVLEANVVSTAGGGTIGSGFFCQLVLNEDPV